MSPISNLRLNSACDSGSVGWPCDPEIERLRDAFARESDPAERKGLAEAIQARALEQGIYAPRGEWWQPRAYRASIEGMVDGPHTYFWNVERLG